MAIFTFDRSLPLIADLSAASSLSRFAWLKAISDEAPAEAAGAGAELAAVPGVDAAAGVLAAADVAGAVDPALVVGDDAEGLDDEHAAASSATATSAEMRLGADIAELPFGSLVRIGGTDLEPPDRGFGKVQG